MKNIVSIVVPVYNAEKSLKKCVNLIQHQTYRNIEIILVDDGSTDKSGVVCDALKNSDKRIKVIHTDNAGVSSARNDGIKISTGKYITFVDSDDYIEKNMIEVMINQIINNNADICICGNSDVDEKGNIINFTSLDANSKIFKMDNISALKCMLDEKPYNGVCWGKLYKRSLFNDLYFNRKIRIAEDLEVLYKVFYKAKQVVYIPDALYNYSINTTSVTHDLLSDKWLDEINVCDEIVKFSEEHCQEISDYAKKRYIRINFTLAERIFEHNYNMISLKEIKSNLKKYKLNNKNILNKNFKIKIFLIEYIPFVLKIYYKLKKG